MKEEIVKELSMLAGDLYTEGYHAGINDNQGKWFTAWAVAMSKVAHGEKYDEAMVIRIYDNLYSEEDKA